MKNVLLRGSQSVVFFSLRHFDLQNNENIWMTKVWTCHLKDPKTKRYRCKWNSKKKTGYSKFRFYILQYLADICGSGFGGFLVARDIKNSWILQSCVLASFSATSKIIVSPRATASSPFTLSVARGASFCFLHCPRTEGPVITPIKTRVPSA